MKGALKMLLKSGLKMVDLNEILDGPEGLWTLECCCQPTPDSECKTTVSGTSVRFRIE